MPSPIEAPPQPPQRRSWLSWIVLAALVTIVWTWTARSGGDKPDVPYTTAYGWIRDGKVSEVTLKGDLVTGTLREKQALEKREVTSFQTLKPKEDEALIGLLREKNVVVHVKSPDSPMVLQVLTWILPWVLIIGVWVWLSRR
jgi:cell division protease FtsH